MNNELSKLVDIPGPDSDARRPVPVHVLHF